MQVLLDTQALLWWLTDSDRLGPKARRIFMSEDPVVSPVSLWEIAIKVNLGKLEGDVAQICSSVLEEGFSRLGFSDRHMIGYSGLELFHRDPFDRMLIAQSQAEGIPLLSSDAKMQLYDVEVIDSRN